MMIEERESLKRNIEDAIQSFDAWRQEDVERGGVRTHLQCTKKELEFLLGLIVNKGKWIDVTPEEDVLPIYTCSECGMANLWESPFCPSCGVDMRDEPCKTESEAI